MKRLTLVALLLALSCSVMKAQSLVGTWTCEEEDIVTTLTFNEDGTFVRVQDETVIGRKNMPSVLTSREEGNWKLVSGGKKIYMRYKPASVEVSSNNGSDTLAKMSKAERKANALGTIYLPKLLSLTDNEFVIRETLEDEDGYAFKVKSTFTRVK